MGRFRQVQTGSWNGKGDLAGRFVQQPHTLRGNVVEVLERALRIAFVEEVLRSSPLPLISVEGPPRFPAISVEIAARCGTSCRNHSGSVWTARHDRRTMRLRCGLRQAGDDSMPLAIVIGSAILRALVLSSVGSSGPSNAGRHLAAACTGVTGLRQCRDIRRSCSQSATPLLSQTADQMWSIASRVGLEDWS